ncbi:MAG: hypothetical protein WCP35_11065 [Verrucomicrobiota bacterium]
MTTSTRYSCNYQLAGYSFEYRDEMGAIDFPSFVKSFEAFPWGEQMRQREKMAGGCSATISVVDEEQDFIFWISVMGDDLRPKFLLGAVYNKKLRKSARIKVSMVIRWCEIRIAPSRRSVPSMFRIFFTGDTRKLMKQFRTYKLYDQHEAMMPVPEP